MSRSCVACGQTGAIHSPYESGSLVEVVGVVEVRDEPNGWWKNGTC